MTAEVEVETEMTAAEEKVYEIRDIPGYPGWKADSDGKVYSHTGREVGSCNSRTGYYTVTIGNGGARAQIHRHILVCLTFHGPRPSLLHEVLHYNDIRGDDRPENLRWGTSVENGADRIRNRTLRRGETHSNSTLTEKTVIKIRKLHAQGGWSLLDLAEKYGTSKSNIHHVLIRKSWKHVPDEGTYEKSKQILETLRPSMESAFTPNDILEIRQLHAEVLSLKEIAEKYRISHETIRKIIIRETWSHIPDEGTYEKSQKKLKRLHRHERRLLTDEQAQEIRRLYREGCSQTKIASKFFVDGNTIYQIVHRQTYTDVPD